MADSPERPRLLDLASPSRVGKDLERLLALALLAAAVTATVLPLFQSHAPPPAPDDSDKLFGTLGQLGKREPGHPLLLAFGGWIVATVVAFFAVQVRLGLRQMRNPTRPLFPADEDPTRQPPPWGLADFVLVFLFQTIAVPVVLVTALAALGAVPVLSVEGGPRVDVLAGRRLVLGDTAGVESVTTFVKVPGARGERAVLSVSPDGHVVCRLDPEAPGDPEASLDGHHFSSGERELEVGGEVRVGSAVVRHEAPSTLLLLALQAAATLSIAGLVIAVVLRRGGTLADLGLRTDGFLREAGRGVAGYLAGQPIVFLAMAASWALCKALHVPYDSHQLLKNLETDRSLGTALGVILLAAVVAPIGEEIVYRGFLTRALRRPFPSRFAAAAIASFFFGAMHAGLPSKLPISVVGGVFAAVFLTSRRGSLVGSIVAHVCFNGAVIAFQLALLRVAPG